MVAPAQGQGMESLERTERIRDARRNRDVATRTARNREATERQVRELNDFLESLGRRIERLRESGQVLEGDDDLPPRFIDYSRTRNITSECMAFMLVIDRRIEALPEALRRVPRSIFRAQTVTLWSTLLECSLTFLRAIAAEENLPLGSREVFVREVKTLHDAHKSLCEPDVEGMVSEPILAKHRQAEKILTEIIDRAPRLLDLGS